MKRAFIKLGVFFLLPSFLFAEGKVLNNSEIENKLFREHSYYVRSIEAGKAIFLPRASGAEAFFNAFSLIKPDLSFEMAYLLEAPALNDGDFSEDFLWKALRDLPSLVGIEYYSETKKKYRPLYLQANFLDRKTYTASLIDSSFWRAEEALVLQEDSSFGVQNYTYIWAEGEDYVACTLINETKLSYGIISAIPPKGLRTTFYALPYKNKILLYIFTEINTQARLPKFLEKRILSSLVNRAEVLKVWLALSLGD